MKPVYPPRKKSTGAAAADTPKRSQAWRRRSGFGTFLLALTVLVEIGFIAIWLPHLDEVRARGVVETLGGMGGIALLGFVYFAVCWREALNARGHVRDGSRLPPDAADFARFLEKNRKACACCWALTLSWWPAHALTTAVYLSLEWAHRRAGGISWARLVGNALSGWVVLHVLHDMPTNSAAWASPLTVLTTLAQLHYAGFWLAAWYFFACTVYAINRIDRMNRLNQRLTLQTEDVLGDMPYLLRYGQVWGGIVFAVMCLQPGGLGERLDTVLLLLFLLKVLAAGSEMYSASKAGEAAEDGGKNP